MFYNKAYVQLNSDIEDYTGGCLRFGIRSV
jgi:hypothetical protein